MLSRSVGIPMAEKEDHSLFELLVAKLKTHVISQKILPSV